MVINWYGENCFKIQSGEFTIATDPFLENTGLTSPRFKHDLLLKTASPFPPEYTRESREEAKSIHGPGEYEVKSIEVSGWPAEESGSGGKDALRTSYRIVFEDIRIGILGHVKKMPSPSLIESLGAIDILILPGGGAPYLAEEDAAKVVKQVSPKIVLPALFKVPGLTRSANDAKQFAKELGIADPKTESKLSLKKKDLPEKTMLVILSV